MQGNISEEDFDTLNKEELLRLRKRIKKLLVLTDDKIKSKNK